MTLTGLDPERRSRLLVAKLGALVRDHFGSAAVEAATTGSFPGGATLRSGHRGWVLAGDDPSRALGRALAWANQHGADELHVLAEASTGLLARRAALFQTPPVVWSVDGRQLQPAEAEPPPPPPKDLDEETLAFAPMLEATGAEVVYEHGMVVGEILGLEIARVVITDGGPRIEVGVGRHDREAFMTVHGEIASPAALADVIGRVRRHRHPDAPDHPVRRLAPERWLREIVLIRPDLVGARELRRVEGPVPRASVKESQPAAAASPGVVVACSVGVDLDLVPFAADVRALHEPDARLALVVPERDAVPITARLAAALRQPAEVVAVPGDWRHPG